MTEALERFNNGYCEPSGDGDLYWFNSDIAEEIRSVLKDHEKDKQFCISAQMHTLRLIDKVQGLVRTLEQIRTDAAIDHNGLPPTQIMGNLLGFIEDAATKSLAEFKEKKHD